MASPSGLPLSPDPFAIAYGPADWPEDHAHENGDYRNQCCHCGEFFYGHKRRVTCKRCAFAVPLP
jgi:ribosomal protein S27AE